MKYLVLIGVMLTVGGITLWEWVMARIAAKPTPEPSWKGLERRTYAEGRPTMPSAIESEVELERRTR